MSKPRAKKGTREITDPFELALHRERSYVPNRARSRWAGASLGRVHTLTFAEMQMLMLRDELRRSVYARIPLSKLLDR